MIYWEKMDPQEAIEYIRSLSDGAISSPTQVKYLTNPRFPENPIEDKQPPPTATTPECAECYQTNNQKTDLALQRMIARAHLMGGGGYRGHGGVCFIGSSD